MDEKPYKTESGGEVTEAGNDSDIDQLLRGRAELDSDLHRHKTQLAVLFTDIVGSTSFFERFGDTAGLLMLQRHDELVLPVIKQGGGRVVKTIGDAVLATFTSVRSAADTAIRIQQQLDAYNKRRGYKEQIYVRVGINFGRGFLMNKDVYGDVVNVAARFVKTCAPAQILVTRSVYEALKTDPRMTFRRLGSASFHGRTSPEAMYEVLWTSEEHYQRLRQFLDAGEFTPAVRSVLGRYELLEELGHGAMGVVHKAYDPTVGRIVALKTARVDVTGQKREELIRRLRREAQAAGRLEHPNIVTIYDAGETEGLFYLTMQFVKGKTLAERLKKRKPLPLQEIAPLIDQLCDGLHYAHEHGIVHRDLKPTNVIITSDGTPKIVDFGMAKILEAHSTKTGMVLGTPSYMAPEQAQGGRVDRRSDVFSLGAIFYEALAGGKPFPGNTPTAVIYKIVHEDPIPLQAVDPAIDPGLARAVGKALAKDPSQRYQTCRELQEDVRTAVAPVLTSLPRKQPRPSEASTEKRPAVRGPVVRVRIPAGRATRARRRRPLLLALLLASISALGWQEGWFSSLNELFVSAMLQPGRVTDSTPIEPPASTPSSVPLGTADQPPNSEAVALASEAQKRTEGEAREASVNSPPGHTPSSEAEQVGSSGTAAVQKPPPPPSRARPRPTLSVKQQREMDLWLRQAKYYLRQRQYEKASIALKSILEIDPNNKYARDTLEKLRKELTQREGPGLDQ